MQHNTNTILTTFPVFTSGLCTDLHINISHLGKEKKALLQEDYKSCYCGSMREDLQSVYPTWLLPFVSLSQSLFNLSW